MNPKLDVWIHLEMAEWCIPFLVTLTLTYDLIFSFFVSGDYLLYYKCVLYSDIPSNDQIAAVTSFNFLLITVFRANFYRLLLFVPKFY